MQIKTSQHVGFTLIEVMIVVSIIGLLSAVAMPSFMRSRRNSQQNVCINNMRQIESAKDQWAIERGAKTGDPVLASDINEYIKGGGPKCPAEGVYDYSNVGANPTCTLSTLTEAMHVYGTTNAP